MKRNIKILWVLILVSLFMYCSAPRTLNLPPSAEKNPTFTRIHGSELKDDYAWLRKKGDPAVIAYLEYENKYALESMKHTQKLQEKLYREMVSRIIEDDMTVPVKKGDFLYYYRTEKDRDYSIFCRKHKSMESGEIIILDLNEFADDYEYLELGTTLLSPDQGLLAYTLDTDGSEVFTLFIKDLENSRMLEDRIENVEDIAWGNDNALIFYTTCNESRRSDRVYRHILGTPTEEDSLVFYEEDDAFYASITRTRSDKYFILSTSSNTASESYYLDTDNPSGDFVLISERKNQVNYSVDHINDSFYILTNENAKYYRLMQASLDSISQKDNWKDLIPHRDKIVLEEFVLFSGHMVVIELENGQRRFCVIDLNSLDQYYISFPEEAYTAYAGDNWEKDSKIFRYVYSSFIMPDTVYDHDLETRQSILLKQEDVPGYDKSRYITERIWAQSLEDPDIKIPVSLVYNRQLVKKDKSSPLMLYAYGSYGSISDVEFSANYLSLLDRGVIYAIAHVRGGGELGIEWYEDGRLKNRKNTFKDMIACTLHLIENKYTSRGRIIIHGISAGGQVVGAVANMRPDLFGAVLAEVPFVDVLNTMLDADLPLTVAEYDEWGNPGDREYFDYILSYCPYQNIVCQDYPPMLITAGYNDPRVGYWEPAKFTARLRELKTDGNEILLKTNMGSGHFGSTGRYGWCRDLAFHFAYILDIFGIKE